MGIPKGSILSKSNKSVQNPPAHNAILCALRDDLNPIVKKALCLSSEHSHWPLPMRVIIDMQVRHGLRISKVLRITKLDLISIDKIRIKASKRGTDRLISYRDTFGYLDFCKKTSSMPFKDYDRFFLYRAYRKEGIALFHDKDKKYSVTHAFRHLLVNQLVSEIEDNSLISDSIGHKSKKSLDNYIKK